MDNKPENAAHTSACSPGRALVWAVISSLIAIFAMSLGEMIDPRLSRFSQLVYGLVAMLASGGTATLIARWIRKAVH